MIAVKNISQAAYVTSDLDRAIKLFEERYSVNEFLEMRDVELGALGTLDIAMAYLGDTMIEIIAPGKDAAAMFRGDHLDFDKRALEFHHVAVVLDSKEEFEAAKADALSSGLKIVAEADHEVLDFFYVDTTEDLGHYVEYMFLHDVGKAVFGTIPRF